MKQGIFLFFGLLLIASLTAAVTTYATCLRCDDVASPSDCRQSMTCGEGEICFTREFKDQHGLQGYRLGCEEEVRCNLFFNAKQLFGKRDALNTDPAPTNKCYECCTGNECNGNLCQDKGGVHVPQNPQTTTSSSCSGCPPLYVLHDDKCYFFGTWRANWTNARTYCRNHSADLVSINSKDEQDFLVQQLNMIGSTGFSWLAVGGVYSHALNEWEWVDRTPIVYTNWRPGSPGTLSHTYDWHIFMSNPSSGSYRSGEWDPSTTSSYAFICEKDITPTNSV